MRKIAEVKVLFEGQACERMNFTVCRPDLIDWARVCRQTPRENLKLAFDIAERVYNVTRLLDPEGTVNICAVIQLP